jgi:hypothetical protein
LIRSLLAQGQNIFQIAHEQRLDRRTVHRFTTDEHPEQVLGRVVGRSGLLDEYKFYLLERIAAGCTQANILHAEIQAMGWRGSVQTVRRFVFPLREAETLLPTPPPRVRDITRWITTDPEHLTADDALSLADVRTRCREIGALASQVASLLPHRCGAIRREDGRAGGDYARHRARFLPPAPPEPGAGRSAEELSPRTQLRGFRDDNSAV